MNVATMPEWFLRKIYMDSFHLAYMSFIYQQHMHNSPILVAATQIFIDIANQKKIEEKKSEEKQVYNPILRRVRNKIR
jgi:tetrahydromethanopterin S-methyltransferase subunit H